MVSKIKFRKHPVLKIHVEKPRSELKSGQTTGLCLHKMYGFRWQPFGVVGQGTTSKTPNHLRRWSGVMRSRLSRHILADCTTCFPFSR